MPASEPKWNAAKRKQLCCQLQGVLQAHGDHIRRVLCWCFFGDYLPAGVAKDVHAWAIWSSKRFWKSKNNTQEAFYLVRVFTRALTSWLHFSDIGRRWLWDSLRGGLEGWWQTMTSAWKYVTVFLLPFPHDPPRDLIRELPWQNGM